MGELIVSLEGTPAGDFLSLVLVLFSALAHAIFGAINKSGSDPYLNRGAINLCYGAMAAPFALFILPWPSPALFAAIAVTFCVHILYEWLQARSFSLGAFTLVYPIARGTGPLAAAFLAGLVFNESLNGNQWLGVLLLSCAIFGLAAVNLRGAARQGLTASAMIPGIVSALGAGVMIAVYTTVDAYGVRLASDPFIFLAWFFFTGAFGFPIIAARRWFALAPSTRPEIGGLFVRGIFGALIAFLSFGAIMLATRLGKVAEVAALRETSIIFATAIGVLFFKERVGASRLLLILAIATAAVLVELG
ncbi:MAG: DMT family transporter [Neomegalonema sp.]|nr:DMT family transporter [Neomegalonema sp.]